MLLTNEGRLERKEGKELVFKCHGSRLNVCTFAGWNVIKVDNKKFFWKSRPLYANGMSRMTGATHSETIIEHKF